MKLNNLFYVGALSALALTGCKSNDDNSEWLGSDGIMFTSYIEGLTSRASGSAWDDGDKVGIFMTAGADEFENRQYTASAAGALTPAGSALKWPEGVETADFLAYYPYTASLNGKIYAVDVTNQDDPKAIDLLYSSAKGIATGSAVSLGFNHQLSQIVINVGKDETIASTSGLSITISGMNTQANFDLTDGSLTATDSKANIAMNVNEEGTLAEAIILPTADLNGATMTFTLGSMTFEWPITVQGSQGFEASTKYTYTATLSTVNGQPVVSMGNASIEDWDEQAGGDINVDFEEGEAPSGEEDPFGLDASSPVTTLIADFDEITEQNQNYSKDGWINKSITNNNVWQTATYNYGADKYIKANAYNVGEGEKVEAWFITPAFTVNTNNTFTFDCAGAQWGNDMSLKVYFIQKNTDGSITRNDVTPNNIPTSGGNYTWVKDINVNLSAYNGQVGFIGFQYNVTSTGVNSGLSTYQIDNIKYAEGSGSGEDPNPNPEPQPGTGDGTIDNPYSVAQAIALNNPGTEAYVKAYIIGAANSNMNNIQTSNFSVNSNIVIADNPDETDKTKMMPVQLPNGTIRTEWNLVDNSGKVKTLVLINGSLEAYFSQPGIKSPTSISEVE